MSIDLQILGDEYSEQAFHLATEVFIQSSTLHRALNVTLEEYQTFLHTSFIEMVEEGLSIVALDAGTQTVIGCIIASDFYNHLDIATNSDSKFAPINALGNALACQYLENHTVSKGEVVLSDMAAVSPQAIGKNIYQQMKAFCHENAKAQGFKRIVGELSSKATQHVVLQKFRHKKIAEINFCDFEFHGYKTFEAIKEPPSIILAEGVL